MLRRKGFKYIEELSGDEQIVGMIEFKKKILVYTSKSIYQLSGNKLIKLKIKMENDDLREM